MKKNRKKILKGFGLSILLGSGLLAQNTSWNTNSIPITGNLNSAFGMYALTTNYSGTENTAIGGSALGFNYSGSKNTACGYAANGNSTSGNDNCAFGRFALASTNAGSDNIAIGSSALYLNTSGVQNIAIGSQALYNNTAPSNLGIGHLALHLNTTGGNNTAVGYLGQWGNVTGRWNASFGCIVLGSNNTGSFNSAFGSGYTMANNYSGSYNTAMGWYALYNSGGDRNTAIGTYADVTNYNDVNATALGYQAITTTNKVRLGDVNVTVIEGQPLMYTPSDGRFKTNINENDVKGLEFIKLLRPVVYNFDTKKFQEFLTKNMPDSVRKNYLNQSFENSTAIRRSGFIAQEVEKAASSLGYNFDALHKPDNENDNYSLAYSGFVIPLVKGMQEQQKQIEDQASQIANQNKEIADLKNQMNAQNKTGNATSINQLNSAADGFALDQNVPNPFNGETMIKYTLPQQISNASMVVYDLSGKQLTSFNLDKSASSITITSDKLAAGIYIYSVMADGKIMDSKRMVVAGK